mgnify:CR=1 FL=1
MLPDSVLRVVSLPPTISRIRLPRKFFGSMSRVASLCAIIDNRSLFGGWLMRSFQSFAK